MSKTPLKTTALSAISTPLTATTLIEASAGTGKTFTMASLYLRLLIGVGENNFTRPLTVDEILVVTFTEASTQELKARIRQRIQQAKAQFIAYQENRDLAVFRDSENGFLIQQDEQESADYLERLDLKETIQRLQFAEQNMDLAAIYTIHGFCRRMLMQYAVNSGIHFNLELVKDENALLIKLTNEFWREQFYGQSLPVTQFIAQYLGSPARLLQRVQSYLTGKMLKVGENQPHLLEIPLNEFLTTYIAPNQERILPLVQEIKTQWQSHFPDFSQLFLAEYKKSNMGLNGGKFRKDFYESRVAQIKQWVADPQALTPPAALWFFTQEYINGAFKAGNEPFKHAFFQWLDEKKVILLDALAQDNLFKNALLYHCAKELNARLVTYKQNHPEKGFNDLLRLLNVALHSEQGERLAGFIRQQYPFAMIDEFQDTDEEQYQIFSKIYVNQPDCGFMMIGDPKQAIYQFRGADIFTYLKAAEDAKEQRFTLNKNYRSGPELIYAVNQLLDFDRAFLNDKIQFEPVESGRKQPHFALNGKVQAPLQFYLNREAKLTDDDMAECCAESILHWLQSAEKNQAVFVKGDDVRAVQSDDIAVLVRGRAQAEKIQNALRSKGIASVYLSDRSNVFDSAEARELAIVLKACLYPTNERYILNAISTGLFAFTAVEIYQVKQSEALLEQWVSRFEHYHQLWQRQGVLSMIYQCLLAQDGELEKQNLPEKMLALPKGERRLTDVLHLAELLQQAAALQESESALLRWFERQIQGANVDDEIDGTQVRLESEQKLVKIVTIHKSKGLEYGLVWLPFLGYNGKDYARDVTTYHNELGEKYWDLEGEHNVEADQEAFAEAMRLLYVALTRAKYQLSFVVPTEFDDRWNPLLYSLTQGQIGTLKKIGGKPKGSVLVDELKARLGDAYCQIAEFNVEHRENKWATSTQQPTYSAAEFSGRIEQNWGMTSFSGLTQMHERQLYRLREQASATTGLIDDARDYDRDDVVMTETELCPSSHWQGLPAERSPFHFPAGAKFGVIMHSFFEKNDFRQGVSDESAVQMCHALQLDESWQEPLKNWLQQVLDAPLGLGFCLGDLPPQDCLKEWQFFLKFHRTFDVKAFNQALRDYHPLFEQPYLFDEIQGMLRGFVDLVFRHQGKYYVLDYKTNHLGEQTENYQPNALVNTMKQQHYDLQSLFYTLALHHYLQLRDLDYDYETHFGGVIYTFIRGMNGQAENGVYFDRPDVRLIQALGALFHA